LRQWIPISRLIAASKRLHRLIEQRHLIGKRIAEQARNAQSHVNTRAIELRQWQDFNALDPARHLIPLRAYAQQHQRQGEIFATRAQCGAAPKIEH